MLSSVGTKSFEITSLRRQAWNAVEHRNRLNQRRPTTEREERIPIVAQLQLRHVVRTCILSTTGGHRKSRGHNGCRATSCRSSATAPADLPWRCTPPTHSWPSGLRWGRPPAGDDRWPPSCVRCRLVWWRRRCPPIWRRRSRWRNRASAGPPLRRRSGRVLLWCPRRKREISRRRDWPPRPPGSSRRCPGHHRPPRRWSRPPDAAWRPRLVSCKQEREIRVNTRR